ncbi:hypothetical protein [Thermoleptolyngbya sp. C42_A2020_037]|uniref:hypothetical protein n=1 Tax=Thermoleptolyngbya sp. C42_A2020_037 TaxID=2747799 RepID=UPI0019E7643F|nr:hypothetical protein [Thermoleptolyngbya sp. C42_A2020_037]MBF2085490.1 hypothetical protein [Thermoleptolyngbya sp. C42_A2020_037]
MELLVIDLDVIADSSKQTHVSGLKAETIVCLPQAREILTQRLAHPSSLLELDLIKHLWGF